MNKAKKRLPDGLIIKGRYQIGGYLGRDIGGDVYEGLDSGEERTRLRIKILRFDEPAIKAVDAISREFSFLRRLNHPNLVRVLDFGILEDKNKLFLVEEWVEGQDLYSDTREMGVREILNLIVDLSKTLQYIHMRGVVHGNLNPSNAILTKSDGEKPRLRLFDFGLSRWIKNFVYKNENGVLAYTAPEVLLGQQATAESDLYSLGILTYQLLVRRLPFEDDDPGFLIQKHLQGSVDLRPVERLKRGDDLSRLLSELLDKDRKKRPGSGEEVARRLCDVLGQNGSEKRVKELEGCFSTAQFVGREKEMRLLQERADRVGESGRGWTVFIAGEAGLGKTRCMEEFRGWALMKGWRVIEGTCGVNKEGSYGPYRQILSMTEIVGGEEIFRFNGAPPSAESGPFESSSEYATGQFRDLLTRELVRRLTTQPTILLLHDFHLADEATSTVLDYLSSDIRAHTLLMCVSYRSNEETRRPLGKVIELSTRQQRGEVLTLEPLSKAHVGELVASMLGAPELKETLGSWIYKSIGGNPFFVEEMLKHLLEQGVLRRKLGRWDFAGKDLKDLEVPAGVGIVLRRRLDELSPSAIQLAGWLALINRPVTKALLISIVPKNAEETAEALMELVHRQMVLIETIGSSESVEFRHALIKEVIRGDLPIRKRRKMHGRIAEIIEQECGIEGHLQELATHYMEAMMGNTSVRYALAFAVKARAEYAHESALRCFEYILRNRGSLTREELCIAAIDASDTMCAIGLAKPAISLLESEIGRNRLVGLDIKARMFMQLAISYQHLGDFNMQEACCKKGLNLYRKRSDSGPNLIRAMLWTELAFGATLQCNLKRGLMYLNKAFSSFPKQDNVALAGRMQNIAASLYRVTCNLYEALTAAEKAALVLRKSGESALACSAHSTLGAILMALGRFSVAIENHHKAVALSDKSRSVILKSQALGNLAECLCRMGRIDDAVVVADQASESVSESNNPAIRDAFSAILAEVKLEANEFQKACEVLNQLCFESPNDLTSYTLGHAHYIASSLYFRLGKFNTALKHIDRLNCIESTKGPLYERELAEALKARISFEDGATSNALVKLFQLDKKVAKKGWPYQICVIKLHIVEMLISQRDYKQALVFASKALKLADKMECIPLMSHGHLLRGIIWLRKAQLKYAYNQNVQVEGNIDKNHLIGKAIKELQTSHQIIKSFGHCDIAWRAHYELSMLYKSLGEYIPSLDHAKIAYSQLCKLEKNVPKEMLHCFHIAFNRGLAKSELTELIRESSELVSGVNAAATVTGFNESSRIILRASAAVNSSHELNPLLDVILTQLLNAVDVERAFIFLADETKKILKLSMSKASNKKVLTGTESINHRILETVFQQGDPFVSANTGMDPRLIAKSRLTTETEGILLCAPLKVSGRVLGVLYADHASPVGFLSEWTINLFAAFSNLAAMAIDNAIAHQYLIKEKSELEQYFHQARDPYPEIVGKSALIEMLRDRIGLVAASPLDVLITGESGTGKELVAHAIHRTGRRKSRVFIPVDCGSLSDTLAEAELFGYRKGAFTGATESRQGLFESANGGIIFMDEVSNMPFKLQAKLLRVLQEREIRRIGETMPRKIDVQIIAATNKDLCDEIETGQFRKDLYYRLKLMEVRVPALREHPEDIPLLIEWFFKQRAEMEGGRIKMFGKEAMEYLKKYAYPGNVRELKNTVESTYYTTAGSIIGASQLPLEYRRINSREVGSESIIAERIYSEITGGKANFESLVKKPFLKHKFGSRVVRVVIEKALKATGGIYKNAFECLGIPESKYSVTMQFLKRHGCYLDYRPFRRSNRFDKSSNR